MSSIKNKEYLKLLSSAFSETDFIEFIRDLLNIENDNFNKNITDIRVNLKQFRDSIEHYKYVANYKDSKNNSIGVFIVKLKSTKARNLQRNFVATLLRDKGLDASLVAFYSDNENSWRLSFVKKELTYTEKGPKESLTSAKRYSYLVGENESLHTAEEYLLKLLDIDDRVINVEDIEKQFDVEKVTKKFFDEYKEKYLKLQEYLENNVDFKTESENCEFDSSEFAKKLMGQIVFLYFLQKKGWLGVQLIPNELTKEEYDELLSNNDVVSQSLIKNYFVWNEDKYIVEKTKLRISEVDEDIVNLSNVFKGTKYDNDWGTGRKDFIRYIFKQAVKEHKNFFDDYLEYFFYKGLNKKRENQYFPLFNCKIPFLNGGLFEPLNGYRWSSAHFEIPNSLFGNDDKDGILDFLDLYNFTIDEEEPLEKDIAVDPEMLGKIFENLLDVKERSSKGAFYTPREIVYYMCQESLANYLVNKVNVNYDEMIYFIKYGDIISQYDWELNNNEGKDFEIGKTIYDNILKIDEALFNVKVADPAVGSGAFPLGILNEIVKIRTNIQTYILIQSELGIIDLESLYGTEHLESDVYKMKLQTIENCIYAVDIEPSAIDITKLRLWLSLVVDYPNNQEPRPLPNLDFKIMQGNSLIDEFEGVPLFSEKMLSNNLKNYKRNESKLNRVDDIQVQQTLFSNNDKIDEYFKIMLNLQKEYFTQSDNKIKKDLKTKIDNIQLGLVEETLKDCPTKLEKFKEVSTKRQKPWFIWKLEFYDVFKNNNGFDIVIGNPPYVKERDNKKVFENVKKSSLGRKWYQGKMDYWFFFLHIARDYVNNSGTICFITSRYWLNSLGATKLIKRIKDELYFVDVVDIGNLKVFDNVVGYHMISLLQTRKNDEFIYKKIFNNLSDISSLINTENISIEKKNKSQIITPKNEIVFDELSEYDNCEELGNIAEVSQGVVEASNCISKRMYDKKPLPDYHVGQGIFVLDNMELNTLNLSEDEMKNIKKYVDGNDLSKYNINFSGKYLIYSDSDCKEKIRTNYYPNLKKHLDKMSAYITSDNKPYGIHRPRKKYIFESKKLITPSMFKEPCFVLDKENYYVGMSFNCIIEKNSDYPLEYLFGILNSNFAKEWFFRNGKKRGIGVDIGVDKLRNFPIKKATREQKEKIESVTKRLIENYNIQDEEILNSIIDELYD